MFWEPHALIRLFTTSNKSKETFELCESGMSKIWKYCWKFVHCNPIVNWKIPDIRKFWIFLHVYNSWLHFSRWVFCQTPWTETCRKSKLNIWTYFLPTLTPSRDSILIFCSSIEIPLKFTAYSGTVQHFKSVLNFVKIHPVEIVMLHSYALNKTALLIGILDSLNTLSA